MAVALRGAREVGHELDPQRRFDFLEMSRCTGSMRSMRWITSSANSGGRAVSTRAE